MFSKKIEEVNNPIIYIFLTIAVSCICYGINDDFRRLSIFIAAFFFVYIICYFGIRFYIFIMLFFVIGMYINMSYYRIPDRIENIVRITKINSYNIIGTVDGKNIVLKSNYEFDEGSRYYVEGNIVDNTNKYEGIVGEVEPDEIYKEKDDFIGELYIIKREIFNKLEENLGSRKAGLISSIAFGDSKNIDLDDKSDMKNLGIIHSICVSGLHVAIVYGFLKNFLGNKIGLVLAGLYVIFTGCNYSSIRAFIMLSSVEGAKIFKRNNNSLSALCLSAMILIIYKPYSILGISFHLSYLATLGIILLNKDIKYKLYKLPEKLRDTLSVTLSAQVFTFPYIVTVFKDFSMNFILGNLLLIPFVNILVILGNTLILVYRFPNVFDFISYLCLYIIKLFDWLINKINMYSLPMFYGNEYVAFFYLWMIISVYFMKKGYKKFIYLPAIAIIVIAVQMYSPILNIKYYKEGAIVVSYKGDRALVSAKKEIDLDRLSKISNATKVYRIEKNMNFKNICVIKVRKNDYILKIKDKDYLLKMSGQRNYSTEYDIINFKDGPTNKVFIIDDELIEICS